MAVKFFEGRAMPITEPEPDVVPPDLPDLMRPRDDELDLFGLTHPGKVRPDNQDQFLICTVHPQVVVHSTSLEKVDQLPLRGSRLATLLVVADGVGGAAFGSEAARLATETVTAYVSSTLRCYHAAGSAGEGELLDSLRAAAYQAHDAVRAEAATQPEPTRMATTLTVGIAIWPWLYVVQVGDSRCYYWDGSKLTQVTRDQTVAQDLVDKGVLPPERAEASPFRHVLASAIGADEAMPDVTRIDLNRTSAVILCTDGLTKHVSDEEIAARVSQVTSSEQLCTSLRDLALERGGSDNITIVVGRAPVKQ